MKNKITFLLLSFILSSCSQTEVDEFLSETTNPTNQSLETSSKPKYAPVYTKLDVECKIEEILMEISKTSSISDDMNLRTDLEFDDNDFIDLISAIESSYNIEVKSEDSQKWQIVNDIIQYVSRKVIVYNYFYNGTTEIIDIPDLDLIYIGFNVDCQINYKRDEMDKRKIVSFTNKNVNISSGIPNNYDNVVFYNKSKDQESSDESTWVVEFTLIKGSDKKHYRLTYKINFRNDLLYDMFSPEYTNVELISINSIDYTNILVGTGGVSISPSFFSIFDKIISILQSQNWRLNISLDSSLKNDFYFDELDMWDFILEVEETFDIAIPYEDWVHFEGSIFNICSYINSRLN